MRSSVRSRLAPPCFQALANTPAANLVTLCHTNLNRLALELPQLSSAGLFGGLWVQFCPATFMSFHWTCPFCDRDTTITDTHEMFEHFLKMNNSVGFRRFAGSNRSSYRLALPTPPTHLLDEQIANRPCKTHSSTASAAPAASYKSPYRKCPGGTHLPLTPLHGAGAFAIEP